MHSPIKIAAMMKRLRDIRTKKIDAIFCNNPDKFGTRTMAAIHYDNTLATVTNNEKMLNKIGIDPNNASLTEIFQGLATWNIYLMGTDHLEDSELLELLLSRILKDKVRLVPTSDDMSEFIDLMGTKPLGREDDDTYEFTPKPVAYDEDNEPIFRSALLPKNSRSPGIGDTKTTIITKTN